MRRKRCEALPRRRRRRAEGQEALDGPARAGRDASVDAESPDDPKGLGGNLRAFARGKITMTGNAAAIAGVRAEVDAAVARWQAFDANEPDLAQALVKECRDGIGNRLETD